MPSKAAPKAGGKEKSKADLAKKQKLVEDKMFGLKNKHKSRNVYKYVQSLHQSVQNNAQGPIKAQAKKKKEEAARDKELNELLKVAISQPKVPLGVEPKCLVCGFFRHGQCAKGFKCKYSHDLRVERKGEKIDIYSDQRDDDETMDEWDQETLEKAVAAKANEYNNNNNKKPTEIVCKHFLDAVERKQYGWFWTCPNGGKDCHYRHALPPGYVLKSQMKALLEEEGEKLTIEEEIENQRRMTKTTTPMTAEVFADWKRKKAEAREAELSAKRAERARADRLSGRELFVCDASLFVDDAEAYDICIIREEEQIEEKANISDGKLFADDDDELDLDELDELESSIHKTSLAG
ncbi:hypothetical protein KC19_2G155200 [Ceratodon purpureus]|uniref:C3H1-type domain-containing protein n=1 Tax=Ceratodon purpureus TaxID=3225 RepID=A0A8T0IUA6_CERPU|nr:hypothetical protein KC19_2G155200 [Ceratodon purpureus]